MSNNKLTDNAKKRFPILLFLALVLIFVVEIYFLMLYFFRNRASFFAWSKNFKTEQVNHRPADSLVSPKTKKTISGVTILDDVPVSIPDFKKSSTSPIIQTEIENPVTLYLGVFGYSSANIDGSKTNLYFDDTVKGLMFPLNYDWQEADSNSVAKAKNNFNFLGYNNFSGPDNDVSCLGKNCLTQKNVALSYNGRALSLPSDINRADIAAISIAALSQRWLIGFTLKTGQGYNGVVYYFDGKNFSKLITPEPIISSYFGLFGFGGEESDFIVLYGGTEGIAYQVKGSKLINLNKFFNLRTMNGGFRAGIIRAAYQGNVNWYIYSKTTSRPHLIKLWQNSGSTIAGVTSFAKLFSGSEQQAVFKVEAVTANKIKLLARITGVNGELYWKEFSDYGFKNNFSGVLTTSPQTHGGSNSEIIIRNIINSHLDVDENSRTQVKFFFSLNGEKWQDLPSGENFNFVTPRTKRYYLKLTFLPLTDKFYSPYIGDIFFSYQCEKF